MIATKEDMEYLNNIYFSFIFNNNNDYNPRMFISSILNWSAAVARYWNMNRFILEIGND